jgi:hypothetical protein
MSDYALLDHAPNRRGAEVSGLVLVFVSLVILLSMEDRVDLFLLFPGVLVSVKLVRGQYSTVN